VNTVCVAASLHRIVLRGRIASWLIAWLAVSAISPLSAQELVRLDAPGLHDAWLVPNDSPRTEISLLVRSGARDEPDGSGLAHYAEHLSWLSAIGAGRKGVGRDSNASTDRVLTRYWLEGPREEFGDMLDKLSRVLEPIELPEPFMREEVGIVQREYDLRVRDAPGQALTAELASLQHENQWPARSIIGTPEAIARLTPEQGIAWQAATHRPDNTVLVVHGDHEPAELDALLRARFASPSAGGVDEAARPTSASEPIPRAAPYRMPPPARKVFQRTEPRFAEPQMQQTRLVELTDALDPDELDARLSVLWSVLDSSRPGGLAGPLRFDDFVARGFDLGLSAIDDRHVEMGFTAWPDRDVDNATLLERYETVLHDSARAGIPQDTFERAQAGLLDDIDQSDAPDQEVLGGVFASIAQGTTPISLPEWRARVAGVTLQQTDALLAALADAPRVMTFLIEPGTP